jgi:hypothetical protein
MASDGFYKYNSEYVLKEYFKDVDTFNFKHGLEWGLNSNLKESSTGHAVMNMDEDPTILGFDVVILDKSPLFNEIDTFLDFGDTNNIKDISNRREIYDDFVKQFAKFFNVDDRNRGEFKVDNRFNSFKTHYLNSVNGLSKMIHSTGGISNEKKAQMAKFGTDKLTFNLSEDVGLNAGYLSGLYRNLFYSKKNGRQVIPDNLMRFDMVIIISEIRNFNRVADTFANVVKRVPNKEFTPGSNNIQLTGETNQFDPNTPEFLYESEDVNTGLKMFKDNVNRYIFTLYDCQLDFNNYSFEDSITQAGYGAGAQDVSKGLSFDVFYKYVNFEMEKFNFHPGAKEKNKPFRDEAKYINDTKPKPTTFQENDSSESGINQNTDAKESDRLPNRVIDLRYQMNTVSNSSEKAKYEFDFPMIDSNYARSQQDIRNRNMTTANNQSPLRSGINQVIGRANQDLQNKVLVARTTTIANLAQRVREQTGLRNISSPTNVYQGTNLGQFVLNQVRDFGNVALSTALGQGAGFLNQKAQGLENSLFDRINGGVERLQGFEKTDNQIKYKGGGDIPNVYER